MENDDVVGAVLTGDAPTTSEWSTIWLPTNVHLILETWRCYISLWVKNKWCLYLWVLQCNSICSAMLLSFGSSFIHLSLKKIILVPAWTWFSTTDCYVSHALTHCGQDEMAAILQTMFSNAFSWMKVYEFGLKFHWRLFPKGPINNIPALLQIMAWRRPGHKPLSEPMMVVSSMHICVTRPQWVNSNQTISCFKLPKWKFSIMQTWSVNFGECIINQLYRRFGHGWIIISHSFMRM